jgi:hypoxanthine phosphoribosyltransferase
MLSHYFEVPFVPLQWQTYTVDPAGSGGKDLEAIEKITQKYVHENILLVDDINDTGNTLLGITSAMDKQDYFADVKVATLFNKTTSAYEDVNYYAHELTPDYDPWVVFPFEEWWKM